MKIQLLLGLFLIGLSLQSHSAEQCKNWPANEKTSTFENLGLSKMNATSVPCYNSPALDKSTGLKCFAVYGFNSRETVLNAVKVFVDKNGEIKTIDEINGSDLSKVDPKKLAEVYSDALVAVEHKNTNWTEEKEFIADYAKGMTFEQIVEAKATQAAEAKQSEWLDRAKRSLEKAKKDKERQYWGKEFAMYDKHIEEAQAEIDGQLENFKKIKAASVVELKAKYQGIADSCDRVAKENKKFGLWAYEGTGPKSGAPAGTTAVANSGGGPFAYYSHFSKTDYKSLTAMANGPSTVIKKPSDQLEIQFAQVSKAYKNNNDYPQGGGTAMGFLSAIDSLREKMDCPQPKILKIVNPYSGAEVPTDPAASSSGTK